MFIQKASKKEATLISVTATATNIFDLINTAATTTTANAGYSGSCNAILIHPEDGDIRVLFDGNTPTAALGFLIRSGDKAFLPNVPLKAMQLIRTGGANVACSIMIGKSDVGENIAIDSAGSGSGSVASEIQGNIADNAADSGNPVKTGGKYNATAPTYDDGDRGDTQLDSKGNTLVSQGTKLAGEDLTNDLMGIQIKPVAVNTYNYTTDMSAALEASTIAKASAGNLFRTSGRVDATCPTGTYYLLTMNSATLPADGAVTLLCAPMRIDHITGTNSPIDIRGMQGGAPLAYGSAGIVQCLSTTEFTKTITGAYLSLTSWVK